MHYYNTKFLKELQYKKQYYCKLMFDFIINIKNNNKGFPV